MRYTLTLLMIILMMMVTDCKHDSGIVVYHKFKDRTWERFDILKFDIPVEKDGNYDVILDISYVPDFERDVISFNMVMMTPSGEERINEFKHSTRMNGKQSGICNNDSCFLKIPLKTGLSLNHGILKLEIENLVPYLESKGFLGMKISVIPRL